MAARVVLIVGLLQSASISIGYEVPTNNCSYGNNLIWQDRCGLISASSNRERVVNGIAVEPPLKYPWHVGIRLKRRRNYFCGGSLISARYVLTATHCSFRYIYPIPPFLLVIGVGDHDMKTAVDDIPGVTAFIKVDRIFRHEGFASFLTYTDDIALLRLEREVSFANGILPVCLPFAITDSSTFDGYNATLTGWGYLYSSGVQAAVLQAVTLPVLNGTCDGTAEITERQLCTGSLGGTSDGCNGDSGGPLVVQCADRMVQIGVVSYAPTGLCAIRDQPLVYTRVTAYLPWVMGIISEREFPADNEVDARDGWI